ncbi:phosphonate degradation HD-domain oxygenase [Uliginosibacterium sp. H1]|uniref:phosphonate degradation HD-domain oxygenase n=1 Tax=Uliginosibacterium sp. H1 TaxID=3114757 RepID=UPI002E1866B6|nr:phosphonate degradation HD-domain oxygenase [Uliginosibacterium sp. H1]
MKTPHTLSADAIQSLFERHGAAWYGGEAMSQLEHALQCAQLAEQAGEPPAQIVAALLHDLGHLLIEESHLEDKRHQELVVPGLNALGDAVVQPIRLHVAAKRYLCAVDADYWASLSPASKHSLELQGGIYDTEQACAFIAQPYAEEAVRLRRYDDLAKTPGLPTPDFAHYRRLIEALGEAQDRSVREALPHA